MSEQSGSLENTQKFEKKRKVLEFSKTQNFMYMELSGASITYIWKV